MAEKKIVVLDASVVIKWFSNEEFTDRSLEIRQDYLDNKIEVLVPDLILNELANALRYNPEFDSEEVKKAIQSIFDMDFKIIAPSPEILERATEISFKNDTTIYDSTYLALGDYLECEVITCDEELVDKVSNAKHLKTY